jgi:hypothetical protein
MHQSAPQAHLIIASQGPNILAFGCDLPDGTATCVVREDALDGDRAARDGAHAVLVAQIAKPPVSN